MKFKAYQQKKQFISDKIVIGIDPGKEKHQAAILDEQGLQIGNSFTFPVNYEGFNHKLWQKIKKRLPDCCPEKAAFAVETACNLWKTIAYYLHQQGYTVLLVSPLTTHYSRPLINHDFSRTDPKDALLIATNARNGNYDLYQTYESEVTQLHQLSITYEKLWKDKVRNKQRMRAFMEQVFPEYLECFGIGTQTSLYLLKSYFLPHHFLELDVEREAPIIEKISRKQHGASTLYKLKELAANTIGIDSRDQEEILRLTLNSWIALLEQAQAQLDTIAQPLVALAKKSPYFEILTSFRGVSDILASRFIAECRDLNTYSHYKQIEKFSGLNLRQSQSGQYIGARHISHIGNRRLSKIIYQMTEQTARSIPEVRLRFLRRQLKKKSYRKNIVACTSQLLKLIMALVKEKRPYEYRDNHRTELRLLEARYQASKTKKKAA